MDFDCGSGTEVVPAKEPIYLYDTADMITHKTCTIIYLSKLSAHLNDNAEQELLI